MKRFIQGVDRTQGTLLPELLDDYVSDTNPVRVVDVLSMNWISLNKAWMALNLQKLSDLPITQPYFSK
jgi:hypothetical protein